MIDAIRPDLDLWEIWIEFDQSHPEYFGTLYVHGEVAINKNACASLTRINSKGGTELSLRLPACSNPLYTKEVVYSEPIRTPGEYTSVCIYAGNKPIGRFNEIEIMI
jgi:hypothetical protein